MRRYYLIISVICVIVFLAGCNQPANVAEGPAKMAEGPAKMAEGPAKMAEEPAKMAEEPAKMAEEPANAAELKIGEPKITFENVVHDFGEVSGGMTYAAEFKFTNDGEGPLKITEVKKCCGVITRLDKTEYEAGESGILEIGYRSSRSAGTFNKQVHVISNDNQNPKLSLTLKAKIVPKVVYEPDRLEILLKGENAGCPEIMLKSIDNQAFSIESFTSSSNCITAEVDSSVEEAVHVIQPDVDFEKLKGLPAGFITFILTHPECDIITIYFSTLPEFEIMPKTLIVMNPVAHEPVVKKLSIKSNYNEDFEIDSASSQNGCVKILSQKKINKGYRLEVEITPPPGEDVKRFSDTFTINLKGGEKLEVPCRGAFVAPKTQAEQ